MPQAANAVDSNEIIEYLDHPVLKPFIRKIPASQYLFRQGEDGSSMFIILDGTVWLIAEKDGQEHVAQVLERGQFLGERSVMGHAQHKRFFSALAKNRATVLELETGDFDSIHNSAPELMIDMLRRMFTVAAARLDRSNHMVRILRSSDNIQRLVDLILYFAQASGREVPEGVEFLLSDDSIHYHVDMGKGAIEECLRQLEKKKLIRREVNQYYILRNAEALREYIPELRSHIKEVSSPMQQPKSRSLWPFGR